MAMQPYRELHTFGYVVLLTPAILTLESIFIQIIIGKH